jgi:hypothetical protein
MPMGRKKDEINKGTFFVSILGGIAIGYFSGSFFICFAAVFFLLFVFLVIGILR